MNFPQTFFFGSCVSRDMARIVKDQFDVSAYVARQSWISSFSPPTPEPARVSKLTSAFQQRMVSADLASTLPEQLRKSADKIDILVLDLVDERVGVVPTREGYVTNSYELRNSGWKSQVSVGDVLEFGTRRHFRIWRQAVKQLVELLHEVNLFDKTVLIQAIYAEKSLQGDILADKMRKPPHEWNRLFRKYYKYAKKQGFRIALPSEEQTLADRNHTWGLEAFHYTDDYYFELAKQVHQSIKINK